MGILSWIIFGAIAGWLASMVLGKNKEQGALGNIVVGILGAAVGGWLAGFLFDGVGVTGFNVRSFLVAIVGAVILLAAKSALTGKKTA
jgi:uncharacterized membrane protein YeaQ/YmgE (transglycosylase-associated protein family)